jgi:hypothetical protein
MGVERQNLILGKRAIQESEDRGSTKSAGAAALWEIRYARVVNVHPSAENGALRRTVSLPKAGRQ